MERARASGQNTRKDLVAWLKHQHALSHGRASTIAAEARKPAGFVPVSAAELLAAQYAGAKANPRRLYECVVAEVNRLSDDVTIEARQTDRSFVRRRQFGVVQASTASRLDLGLILPGVAPTTRLQAAGAIGSGRITHRVALASADDLNPEVLAWPRAARDAEGGWIVTSLSYFHAPRSPIMAARVLIGRGATWNRTRAMRVVTRNGRRGHAARRHADEREHRAVHAHGRAL